MFPKIYIYILYINHRKSFWIELTFSVFFVTLIQDYANFEVMMIHMQLFSCETDPLCGAQMIINRRVCEYTEETEEILLYIALNCSMGRQASLLFAWGWKEGTKKGRRGCFSLTPPPLPLQVKKKNLNSPLSIPMDHITGDSSTETSAPPLTTERVPASQTCDRGAPSASSSFSSSCSCPLPHNCDLSVICVNAATMRSHGACALHVSRL